MTVVKNSTILSALWSAILWLWGQLTNCFIGRFIACVWRAGRGSTLIGFVRREGALDGAWQDSKWFRLVDKILNAPGIFCKFLRRKTEKLGDSWVFGALGYVGRHYALFGGLVFAWMLLTQSERWNNLYAVLAVAALLVLAYIGMGRVKTRRLETAAAGPYLPIYVLLVAYAFISSPARGDSLRFLLFHLTSVVIVYLMVSGLTSLRDLKVFIRILLAAVTVMGLIGCYQRFLGVEPDDSLVDMTLDLNKDMPGRVYSTFENPNNFAELLLLTIPLYLAEILSAKRIGMKLLAFVCMLPPLLSMAMTYSRSGWIGLVLAVLLFVALKNWRLLPVILILGLAALPFLPASIHNRILSIGSTQDSSTRFRFDIYEAFFRVLRDKWLTGIGLGSDVVYDTVKYYPQMRNGYFPIHAHNNYVQLLAEMGALGLLGYVGTLLNSLKRGIKAACSRRLPREAENYVVALVASLAGIAVVGIAEYTWFYPRVMFMFWATIGLIAACVHVGKREVESLG